MNEKSARGDGAFLADGAGAKTARQKVTYLGHSGHILLHGISAFALSAKCILPGDVCVTGTGVLDIRNSARENGSKEIMARRAVEILQSLTLPQL